jgi:predicted dehydrogenase
MAARLDDRYELVAGVFSADPARSRESRAEILPNALRAYSNIDQMIEAERARLDRVDAVSIVTPNHAHHAAAKAFLKVGFHVICDKPLTTTIADAEDLVRTAAASGRMLAVTYNYSGYPLVRQALEMVGNGKLGSLRVMQVEYAQQWLSTALEAEGNKQAMWRTDPDKSSVVGALGDIGTHAFHLVEFVTGCPVQSIAAELSTHVARRRLDDNAHVLLRFGNGARGSLWASQVALGNENGLRLRIYGDRGSIEWSQETPDRLDVTRQTYTKQVLTRGGAGIGDWAAAATRVPSGHPEGYIEAFAQVYKDIADLIGAVNSDGAKLVPTGVDGLRGVRFVHAAVRSNQDDAAWVDI